MIERKRTDKRAGVGSGLRPRLHPIGVIRSRLTARAKAPKQGDEGAPDAWLRRAIS